jgi:regulator of protease activity HflC (stomatin/prohibitin superfamily)
MVVLVIFVILVLVAIAIPWGVRIVRQYERGVVFRLGRVIGEREPGLRFIIPLIDRMVKVNMQVTVVDVPRQTTITKDNVTVSVDAVVYYRVKNATAAIVNVQSYWFAVGRLALTTLRSVLGQHTLDELLQNREQINAVLKTTIDAVTEEWGIEIVMVETKDVDLPETMQRAMARQAEAERERRARIIEAQGELQASEQLAQAGEIVGRQPIAYQIRMLQTLAQVASERNSVIVFPIPVELLAGLGQRLGAPAGQGGDAQGGHGQGRDAQGVHSQAGET